jgi:16S rRNA (uracil1498-N3)-methyltransferase
VEGERVSLRGAEDHYVRHVLRLGPGDRFSAVLPTRVERVAIVESVTEGGVEAELGEERGSTADPLVDVRLRPALVKGRKLDPVIRQCTELGVAEIGPVLCERSVSRPDGDSAAHRAERWEKIALEAARQCGRRTPPQVAAPLAFPAAVAGIAALGGTGLILAPGGSEGPDPERPLLGPQTPEPISALIGPEGGFTNAEVELAEEAGLRVVGLGRRILRADTAAIVVCALLMHELGELA